MVLHNVVTEEMPDMPDKTKLVMKGNWGVVKCPGEGPKWAKDIIKLHPMHSPEGSIMWKTIEGQTKLLKEEKHKCNMVAITDKLSAMQYLHNIGGSY
eukprot:9990553-Prorocentrum_lima.AAC.1